MIQTNRGRITKDDNDEEEEDKDDEDEEEEDDDDNLLLVLNHFGAHIEIVVDFLVANFFGFWS